jgi:hypothetical protein
MPNHQDYSEGKLQQHDEETRRIIKKVLANKRCLELEVTSPVTEFIYRIRWQYKKDKPKHTQHLAQEGKLQSVRAKLIASARDMAAGRANPDYDNLVSLLKTFLENVKRRYCGLDLQLGHGEALSISLAVFDDKDSVLRFVATNDGLTDALLAETFSPGEGCSGFSFEKARILFYAFDRDKHEIGYYIAPSEIEQERGRPSALSDHKVLVTIPWIDETGIAVGVISIGSNSPDSLLLPFFDMNEAEQEQERKFLLSMTRVVGNAIVAKLLLQ